MKLQPNAFPDMVMYPSRDFFSIDWRRYHSPGKIEALARHLKPFGARILVVNRPIYPGVSQLQRPKKWTWWIHNARARNPQQLADNLFVITPLVPIPDPIAYSIPASTKVNRQVLGTAVRHALRRLRFSSSPIAWVYNPYQLYYLGMARERLDVYEIHDEYGVKGLAGQIKTIVNLELQILARVDIVFTTARVLREAKAKYRPNIHWVPNAANVELFARVQDPNTPVADVMKSLPHPIIGYLGTIHIHTDISLLKYIAERHPEWTIVMIGPEENTAFARSELCQRFRQLPNVHMLGYIPQEETPPYCKAFDVGIIPYRIDSRFNYYVNPLKLHEYTAMGKPVVTTRIPEVESHKDIVWIADTQEEFNTAIDEALRTDSPERIAERLRRAQKNSWDVRVSGMLDIILEKLQHHTQT